VSNRRKLPNRTRTMKDCRKYRWTECPDCHLRRWAVIRTLDRSAYRQCQDCVRAKAKRVFKIGRAHTIDRE